MLKGHVFENQTFSNKVFALFMDFFLNKKSGILKGCKLSYTSSSISIGEGVFFVRGRPLEIIGSETKTTDVDNAYCTLVCEIDLSKENTETELNQANIKIIKDSSTYPTLTQEDITDGGNIYQFPFAQFKTTSGVISEFKDVSEGIDYNNIYKMIQEKIDSIIDGSAIVQATKLASYPIGSIYECGNLDVDPNKEFGGTWEVYAEGEVLVGYKEGDSNFGTIGKSLGAISNTTSKSSGNTGSTILSLKQIPSHSHAITDPGHTHGFYGANGTTGNYWNSDRNGGNNQEQVNKPNLPSKTGISIGNSGGGEGHSHSLNQHAHSVSSIQPSKVVRIWIRVA